MRRSHLIIAVCLFLAAIVIASIIAFPLFSPNPASNSFQIEWQQFLPGITGKEIIQTSDGGYLALGTTASIEEIDNYSGPTFVNEQPILVKTDNHGNVQWQKIFQVEGLTPQLFNIFQAKDGGYAVIGGITSPNQTSPETPYSRFCFIKLNPQGNTDWIQTYSGPSSATNKAFNSILQMDNGSYVLFGLWTVAWDYHGFQHGYLIKTDEAGNAYFSQGANTGPASSMIQESDGYIFFTSRQATGGGTKFMLVKTDFNGTALWSNDYKEEYATSAYLSSGLVANDGGYLLCGNLVSPDEGWLVKTDAEGRMVWNKTYAAGISSVARTIDGGYIICGSTNVTNVSYVDGTAITAWFAKIDNMGNIEDEFRAGPVELKHWSAPNSIIQTSQRDFISVGTWDQTYQAASSQRFWIAKISL
jgi:hypothetical protein